MKGWAGFVYLSCIKYWRNKKLTGWLTYKREASAVPTGESKKRKRGFLAWWVYDPFGYLAYKILWMLSFPVLKLLFGLEINQ